MSAGTCLVVQWLRLHASNVRGTDSIPGQGPKIPHAVKQNKYKKDHHRLLIFFFKVLSGLTFDGFKDGPKSVCEDR